jgi:hypothetical protein
VKVWVGEGVGEGIPEVEGTVTATSTVFDVTRRSTRYLVKCIKRRSWQLDCRLIYF